MKRSIIIGFLLFALSCIVQGQTSQIYISVVLPDRNEIPSEAGKQLERKMIQLLTSNGISSQDSNNRFVITAKADITSKDIVASTPQRVSEKIDLTLIIGDMVENKIFETVTIPLIGIGTNENKAFISAINQVKPQKAELVEFLDHAKRKIVDYYAVRCSQIIKDAQKLASANNYDEAIYQLMQVPDICDCAKECQNLMIEYIIKRNNAIAAQLFNEAKARWAASPSSEGASDVADIIARIPAGTSSQKNVDALIKSINNKLREDEKREWAFKMKQYDDAQEKEKREFQLRVEQQMANQEKDLREYQLRVEQQKADNKIREKRLEADTQQKKTEVEAKQRQQAEEQATRRKWIDAAKSVGLGFVNNLPKTIDNIKRVLSW